MLFYLTTLNLARFLRENALSLSENESDVQVVAIVDAWKHADFLCRNYILNQLDNTLYNVYSPIKTTNVLWDSLDHKYKTEDVRTKKFIVSYFLDFKMADSKTVINQVQELQVILHEIHAEGMSLRESFQVAVIIEKLPLTWGDFKNYLKHKCKEMSLDDLIVRLRIEEDNRGFEKKNGHHFMESKANIVEHKPKFNNKKRKHPGRCSWQGVKSGDSQNFNGKCFLCDKMGHRAKDCCKRRTQGNYKKKPTQANLTEEESLCAMVSHLKVSGVVYEVNLVDNRKAW
ncbi:uncharacterized protein LOC114298788 [Camellia sinensis]|uniref:uncharacterized protein LOC114298788 n=1 Tax=Camellia sinensis TaxID=4442 RepID=UPI0010365A8E|nr:uncharacterized protein LOC114298788 [Camellia sinensis]